MDVYEPVSESETEAIKILYTCTKCQSPMEIGIIDEKNNKILFKCINSNEHKETKSIKEYIEYIKNNQNKYWNKNNNDKCCSSNGYDKFEYFCVDCQKHICKKCLEKREHINHIKNNILEVQPRKEEIDIIKDIITFYEDEEQKLQQRKIECLNQIKEEDSKKKLPKNGKMKENENIKIIDENIENLMNIKKLLEFIFQAYDEDKNNYYYSKNIFKILESTKNNNIIVSKDIMQRIEKEYNHIIKINQQNKKIDELNSLITKNETKIKENEEIIKEKESEINNYVNKIKGYEIENKKK